MSFIRSAWWGMMMGFRKTISSWSPLLSGLEVCGIQFGKVAALVFPNTGLSLCEFARRVLEITRWQP